MAQISAGVRFDLISCLSVCLFEEDQITHRKTLGGRLRSTRLSSKRTQLALTKVKLHDVKS